ncbi:MAG: (d)CMP kinase, partial [Acidobacteria bacterium]|nr:(d)CMP kinase [Acidobacteriota bacterium]
SVQDPNVDFEATFVDMTERDRRDSTRADSPLRIAENAVVIDSTGLSIDEVFAKMIAVVQATLATPGDW